jgi:hypothetical protein
MGLANRDLECGHMHFSVQALDNLGVGGCLEEQFQRLLEIGRASSIVSPWLATSTSGQCATNLAPARSINAVSRRVAI